MGEFDFYGARTTFLMETRTAFAMSAPRLVDRPSGDLDRRMEAHWLDLARRCNRPRYHEAVGFTADKWQLDGTSTSPRMFSICGHEKAYGFGRSYWKYVWLAVKAAWWSGWHDATGATYKTTQPGSVNRSRTIISGLTS